jgi:hypothetical protein
VDRLLIAAALAVVAALVALWLERRRPRAPVAAVATRVPPYLDRNEFDRPEAPWLVAAFTSATCDSCASVWARARVLESPDVVVQQVEVGERRDLHQRYRIDSVPLVVVADDAGAVRAHFLGPLRATDLWGTLAELRQPGTLPPDCSAGHG